MSFVTELNKKCKEYTNMVINGTKIQVPYYLSGKNLPSAIRDTLTATGKSGAELQEWANNHKDDTGVDCSGLVYYALNEASNGSVRSYFENVIPNENGGNLTYSWGISAANLTDTQYGVKITRAADMVPGCTMRSANGGHVLVITGVSPSRIDYTHSNASSGPHAAYISIGNPNADLKDSAQTWHDIAYTDSMAKSYYNYTVLLNCISQYAGKWVKTGDFWYYYESGQKLTGWQDIGGFWYYLGTDGKMLTGWQQINNVWYYLHSDGRMASSEWVESNGEWYYLHQDGSMATNYWIETDGKWYYVEADGTMIRNSSKQIDGKIYNFDANGVCLNP